MKWWLHTQHTKKWWREKSHPSSRPNSSSLCGSDRILFESRRRRRYLESYDRSIRQRHFILEGFRLSDDDHISPSLYSLPSSSSSVGVFCVPCFHFLSFLFSFFPVSNLFVLREKRPIPNGEKNHNGVVPSWSFSCRSHQREKREAFVGLNRGAPLQTMEDVVFFTRSPVFSRSSFSLLFFFTSSVFFSFLFSQRPA